METIKKLVETKKFLHKWVNISLKSTNIQKVSLKVEKVPTPSALAYQENIYPCNSENAKYTLPCKLGFSVLCTLFVYIGLKLHLLHLKVLFSLTSLASENLTTKCTWCSFNLTQVKSHSLITPPLLVRSGEMDLKSESET